ELGVAGNLVLNVGGTTTSIALEATDKLEGADGIIAKINAETQNTGVTASIDAATGGLKLQGTSAFTLDAGSDDTVVTALGLAEGGMPQAGMSGTANLRDATLGANNDLTLGGQAIGLAIGDTMADVVGKINSFTTQTG